MSNTNISKEAREAADKIHCLPGVYLNPESTSVEQIIQSTLSAQAKKFEEESSAREKWWRETMQSAIEKIHDVAKYVGQFAKTEIDRQQATIERLRDTKQPPTDLKQ